jgi:hypothetical protein
MSERPSSKPGRTTQQRTTPRRKTQSESDTTPTEEPPMTWEESRRALNDTLLFWQRCEEAGCRRAHACVGELQGCFQRHFVPLPEGTKVWMRTLISTRASGKSWPEAKRIADAELERWIAFQEELDRILPHKPPLRAQP